MSNPIINFIDILSDNNLKPFYREIPEEFEHADELKAEIESNGKMPDSMRYFEVNGFSSPVDLEEFLNKQFNAFKLAIIMGTIAQQEVLFREIQDQLTKTKVEIIQIKQSAKPLNDITLNSLINYKLQFCDDTLNFLNFNSPNIAIKEIKNNEEKRSVYIFRIKDKVDKTGGHILSLMHKELKKAGYIDCTLRDFRKLFIEFGERKPDQTPCPIIWKCNKYNHLAYFIKCINRNFLVQSKSPTNYESAKHLFYNSVEGAYFSPGKVRFDCRLDPEVKKRFNAIMQRLGIVK